jgi:hypothetical protein
MAALETTKMKSQEIRSTVHMFGNIFYKLIKPKMVYLIEKARCSFTWDCPSGHPSGLVTGSKEG